MAYKQNSPIPILQGGTNTTGFPTPFGIAYFDGNKLDNITVGTSGYVLTSNGISGPASWQAVSASGAVISLNGDSGTANPTAGIITVAGGTNITTSATGSTLTVNLDDNIVLTGSLEIGTSFTVNSFTTTGALVSDADGVVTDADAGTAGWVLTSNGAVTPPSFQAPTAPGFISSLSGDTGTAIPSIGNIQIAGDAVNITTSASGSIVEVALNSDIEIDSIDALTTSLDIGITNATDITIGNTNVNTQITLDFEDALNIPAFTTTGSLVSDASGVITDASASTSGFVLTSNGAVVAPSFQALPAGGMSWIDVTTNTQTLATKTGYVSNDGATLVTFTLPVSAAVGDIFAIQGSGTGLFTIAQNSGQTIHFNAVNSTTGATGTVSSTSRYDSITLLCNVADTDFVVNQSVGNFNVV